MAKKRANVASLTPEQMEAMRLQLQLQERAMEMAQAQADREYSNYVERLERQRAEQEAARRMAAEDDERAAQYDALQRIADIYSGQASELGRTFDEYSGQAQAQREAALAELAAAAQRGEGTISEAEANLLRDLVATQAYSDVPLVELGQVQNPLLAGLAAEGADVSGVASESEQARAAAAQLAAMTRGAMRQLNVGEENYLKALQNAGRFAAAQSRQDLAGRQFAVGQGIRSQFDQLLQQIAQQRAADVGAAEQAAARASAEREAYAPIVRPAEMPKMPEPEFDYADALERARLAAIAQIQAAIPKAVPQVAPTTTQKTPTVAPTNDKKRRTNVDPWSGTSTIYNEFI
jgi:hypothetical protein